jgi:hypothetical protein
MILELAAVAALLARGGSHAAATPTSAAIQDPHPCAPACEIQRFLDQNIGIHFDRPVTLLELRKFAKVQSETTVDGYKYNTILGRAYIRTIKTDILRPGNIYVFTKPEFFGKFYVLNNTKFYIDKIANMITFQAWEDIGMSVINIAAVRKLELYSADANPTTNADGLLSSFIPKTEDQLGAVNNRVDAGLKFPQVTQF